MPSAVRLREDYSAEDLRGLARRSRDVNQSRRLLSLAGVRDGTDRGAAAKIGDMDRQTLRDWVHRFNASTPDGLLDNWTEGPKPRCHPSRWPRSPESSRLARTARKTASFAGGVSISSASSPRHSASTSTSATSGRGSRSAASPTSAPGLGNRRRTSGSSRLSKKLPARAEGSSPRAV
jgi:transposase